MNDVKEDQIEIRTFSTMDEIRGLAGFKENNPVNKDNYEQIIGDYLFRDEVNCCREKSAGHLCGEGHKWGFVARLKDKSISIVGNCCARDKFGAEAQIKIDRSKYLNEKKRRERFEQFANLLAEKNSTFIKLDLLEEQLKNSQNRVRDFLFSIGERTRRRLQDMARTSNNSVSVDVVNYKDYVDDHGHEKKERRVSPTRLGTLSGLGVIDDQSFKSLHSSISRIKLAFEKAEKITENSKVSELESLINIINDLERIENEVGNIKKEESSFFSNDMALLCFLVDEKAERYKSARVALELSGDPMGKDKAKNWLSEKEQAIKKALGADKIEIQY